MDKAILNDEIDPASLSFQIQKAPPDGEFRELATTVAVVVITLTALRGIVAWLLKTRRRTRIEKTFERPDGSKFMIFIDVVDEKIAEENALKALFDGLGINPSQLSQ